MIIAPMTIGAIFGLFVVVAQSGFFWLLVRGQISQFRGIDFTHFPFVWVVVSGIVFAQLALRALLSERPAPKPLDTETLSNEQEG